MPENQDNSQEVARKADGTFKKGVSGNPSGRPKYKGIGELMRATLTEKPELRQALVNRMFTIVLKGDDANAIRAFSVIIERLEGRVQDLKPEEDKTFRVVLEEFEGTTTTKLQTVDEVLKNVLEQNPNITLEVVKNMIQRAMDGDKNAIDSVFKKSADSKPILVWNLPGEGKKFTPNTASTYDSTALVED